MLIISKIKKTMTAHEFDPSCLPKLKNFSALQIKRLRLRNQVSQAVFAKILNTSLSTVTQWEQGRKKPRGTSLKLLNLVNDHGIQKLII